MFTINQYVGGKRGTDRPMGKHKFKRHGTRSKERRWVGTDKLASATGLLWTTHREHNAYNELLHWVL
jgi:3-methyladenine DNA glycosylase AlkD